MDEQKTEAVPETKAEEIPASALEQIQQRLRDVSSTFRTIEEELKALGAANNGLGTRVDGAFALIKDLVEALRQIGATLSYERLNQLLMDIGIQQSEFSAKMEKFLAETGPVYVKKLEALGSQVSALLAVEKRVQALESAHKAMMPTVKNHDERLFVFEQKLFAVETQLAPMLADRTEAAKAAAAAKAAEKKAAADAARKNHDVVPPTNEKQPTA